MRHLFLFVVDSLEKRIQNEKELIHLASAGGIDVEIRAALGFRSLTALVENSDSSARDSWVSETACWLLEVLGLPRKP